LDDLVLKNYRATEAVGSPDVYLLSPSKTEYSYFVEFGWQGADKNTLVPNSKSLWRATETELEGGLTQIVLSHKSDQGLTYYIDILLDNDYLFTVKQRVVNHSKRDLKLANYAVISRGSIEQLDGGAIIHEGPIAVSEGKLEEISYDDLVKAKTISLKSAKWIGFSDKYWLSAFVINESSDYNASFAYVKGEQTRYQANIFSNNFSDINAGSEYDWSGYSIFAGAKELDLLTEYGDQLDAPLFDRAVDFGMLYFITKPIFQLLHYFHSLLGNFGVAILLLTVFIKIILFPLAHKGFKGMNRLKELQPKMTQLKEKYQDQPQEFQKQLLSMYKKEKVNPLGGCLPILLQIPIFFALYKVLSVTIEMRHAPFFGWITDLSVQEPITIVNLFGLIPWDPPSFLMIGVFPILMALTMFIQQKLNPEPTDPMQAQVMRLLPLIFLFMFSSFPSGLVIYWTWSNILSIFQQLYIKKIEGSR